MPKSDKPSPRYRNQMNMYLHNDLADRVDAVGLALTKTFKREFTRQDVFKHVFDQWTVDTVNERKE